MIKKWGFLASENFGPKCENRDQNPVLKKKMGQKIRTIECAFSRTFSAKNPQLRSPLSPLSFKKKKKKKKKKKSKKKNGHFWPFLRNSRI